MEATISATQINNLVSMVILNFNFQILINLFFYSAAATTGVLITSKIITLAFEELIRAIRYKWEARYRDKRELAIMIMKILTEGSTTGWNIKPRDIEHIHFVARRLEGVDKNASKLFDQCISSWQLSAIMQNTRPATVENIKFCAGLQNSAQEGCDGALDIVQKWR